MIIGAYAYPTHTNDHFGLKRGIQKIVDGLRDKTWDFDFLVTPEFSNLSYRDLDEVAMKPPVPILPGSGVVNENGTLYHRARLMLPRSTKRWSYDKGYFENFQELKHLPPHVAALSNPRERFQRGTAPRVCTIWYELVGVTIGEEHSSGYAKQHPELYTEQGRRPGLEVVLGSNGSFEPALSITRPGGHALVIDGGRVPAARLFADGDEVPQIRRMAIGSGDLCLFRIPRVQRPAYSMVPAYRSEPALQLQR